MDKLKGNNASSGSSQAHILSRRNDVPSGNYYQMSAQASSGPSVEEEGDIMHDSNRVYSDSINEKPLFTAEEMAALFKKPVQPVYYEMESGYDEQEVEEEKKKIEKDLEEIDQLRRKNPLPFGPAPSSPRPHTRYAHQDPSHQDQSHQDSSQASQGLPEASDEVIQDSKTTVDDGRPLDPNLICPKCGKQYRVGEIQKLRRHINERCNEQCSNEDSDESDEEIDKDEEEIKEMVEQRRKEMQGPSTAEVLFDDGDSSLPYDPNLVCPKCGKQYRVGEIQKLRRHINEFCTGMR